MAAEVFFAGGGADSLIFTGTGFSESTTAGRFDSTYCPSCVFLTNTTTTAKAVLLSAASALTSIGTGHTIFIHFECFKPSSVTSTQEFLTVNDASGNPWLKLRGNGTSILQLFYNSGSVGSPVWTAIGSAISGQSTGLVTKDIKLVLDAGGNHSVEYYIGNTLQTSGSFTQASFTSVGSAVITGNLNQFGISQLLITQDLSTIGAHVGYSQATGAGSNSGWTGAASDVGENATNDTTTLQAATAGLTSTFAYGDVTVPSGSAIKSVFLWSRAKNDGVTPQNIKPVIRSGGTDYVGSSNLAGIGTGYSGCGARNDNDPATAVAWTQSGFNAAEFGSQSAA